MALTLGASSNRDLLLPLPSPSPTPTALPDCCPDHSDVHSLFQPDELPTQNKIRRLADYPLFDSSGREHPLTSLFSPSCLRKQRLMLIFIRNFFCGNCQQYLLTVAEQLPPSSLPSDVTVAIIGCGAPSLLPSYMELTHCPYPLYTDPSAQLYKKLGMQRSWSLGDKAPDYIQQSLLLGGLKSIVQGLKRLPTGDVTKAGEMDQNGGEFLFVRTGDEGFWGDDWQVDWCHRMRNTRDHTEISELKRILGMEEPVKQIKQAETWAPRMPKEKHGRRWTKRSMSALHTAEAEKTLTKTPSHKRSTTIGQSLSEKGHSMMRTLSLKRPGTAGSWARDAVPQKRSLTPAVAVPQMPSSRTATPPSEILQPARPRAQSKSKSAAQILNLRIGPISTPSKNAASKDSVSESHVALVSVMSPGALSTRSSMVMQLGTPLDTPLLTGGGHGMGQGMGPAGAGAVSVH